MRRLAPPFVATFVLACSSKPAPVVAVADPAPVTSASATQPASEHETKPIYADSGVCRLAPSAAIVDCPATGPTLIRPKDQSVSLPGGGNIWLSDDGTFTCRKTFPKMACPAGASCNPPPPQDVDCPTELLPELAPDVKPSKKLGDKCMLGEIRVVCP
jgi:hypothetical protein